NRGGGATEARMASGGGSSLVPALPPFLSKCYDMVDDPSTDDTVSWSKTSNSFVIWDPHAFSQDLLPKYFKHSNLSSFVRQLNTYGFHKVDPDKWEFANEGFLRGQKHLLKTITRRKPAHNIVPQQQPRPKTQSVNEVGNFGFKEEIEILKRDKNALMQELIKVRQHQQNSELELHSLIQRIRHMEQKQLEMMSLLAMVVQTPNFIAQLVQQNVNDRWSNINKRRRLPAPEHNVLDGAEAVLDGQIIKYQPFAPEIIKSSFLPVVNSKESGSLQHESSVFNDLHPNGVSMTAGADLALPLRENGSLTNLEDLEQLLASSAGENSEQIEPGALAEYMRSLDFTEQDTDGCMGILSAKNETEIGNPTSEKGSNDMVVW
ncbi:hypothetical protein B296_00046299, partial [Ensete ventricosum]